MNYETKRQKMHVVYIISDGSGYFKIGRTANVEKRLAGLQTGSPVLLNVCLVFEMMPDLCDPVEKMLHAEFRPLRRSGEWFMLTKNELEWLHAQSVEDLIGKAEMHVIRKRYKSNR
jgi:hypothetical protein